MTLAPHLCFLATALGLLCSCNEKKNALQDEIMQSETEIVELEQKMRLMHLRWEKAFTAEQEWTSIHRELTTLTISTEEKKAHKQDLKRSQEQLTNQLATHQNQWNLIQKETRLKAIGLQFKIFTSKERVYEDVSITHVDAQGVHLNHRKGMARVAAENLSDEQIAYFGLDRTEAMLSKKQEQNQRIAYEQWVETSIQKSREAQLAPLLTDDAQTEALEHSSLFRESPNSTSVRYPSTQNRTVYRVRNQGKPYYYSVYPLHYTTPSGQTLYYYRSYR